jgi:dolichyl-phosphate-mannose-protein mannosyltransferase/putative pyrroloquinoline-quinone binding quinoprotein
MNEGRRRLTLISLCFTALLAPIAADAAAVPTAGSQPGGERARDIRIRDDGAYDLEWYDSSGRLLRRYIGFSRITAVRMYDDDTVLIVEEDRDQISALALDGRFVWTIPLHRPRSVEVLGADRFLVAQDYPPAVVEVNRAGEVSWEVRQPLVDAQWAVRLPDGNTAVVQGHGRHAVDVLSPDGHILWSGTRDLAQPRGLALLPTGELVTSGFDTGQLVIFRPYTENVRSVGFGGHVVDVTVTPNGDLLSLSPELQLVRVWDGTGKVRWQFSTLYHPFHGAMLRNGDVLVGVFHESDRACMNAAASAQRAKRPLASYWIWLATGLGSAILLTVAVQWPTLRRVGSILFTGDAAAPAPGPAAVGTAAALADALPGRRRLEVALYFCAAVALAVIAVLYQERLIGRQQIWLYTALVGGAGLFLALMQHRTPQSASDWTRRMTSLRPMERPTPRMAMLWSGGIILVLLSLYGVFCRSGAWPLGAWSAGLLLLVGGALQARAGKLRVRPAAALAGVLCFAALVFIRVYRLEEYPANLHLDMAQWSCQTFQLIDGDVKSIFSNGWAEIPLLGYGWSALWTAIAGRSLAGCRFASVIGSLMAIAGVFFLVRRLYGTRAATIAALLLGVNHGFLHFSRIQAYMDPIPFQVLALLGLVAGLESGAFGWFALAGAAGGYSALTYHAGRITPPLMLLLGVLLLLRYPRALGKRWPGLLLCAVVGAATVAPHALVYARGAANPFGRADMYPWAATGKIDPGVLRETLATGLTRVIGTFWSYVDTSTQYGGVHPVLFPPAAALLGMGAVAMLLRPRDIRGVWIVGWALIILVTGGVLTRDPPFWPRFAAAFVPVAIIVAIVVAELSRGLRAAFGRLGARVALAAAVGFVGMSAWQNIGVYVKYCKGIPANGTKANTGTQWVQSIMGRDIQRWGGNALVYIVARNNIEQSCSHPTMQFYAYDVDVRDAREIDQYLPFKDPRIIVCYFLPEMTAEISAVRRIYPDAREDPFYNNLGRKVFTRVTVAAPHG